MNKRFWRVIQVGMILCVLLGMTGCFKEDASYVIPSDIYNVSLEKTAFTYKARDFSQTKIAAGTVLSASDFQFRVNDEMWLSLGEKMDVSKLESVKEYGFAQGLIREYKEPYGNYKVLVAVTEQGNYLMAALTISKYVPTYRGVRNGITLETLDVLMQGLIYEGEVEDKQESRIYSFDGMNMIITSKYDIVRSIQLVLDDY